jgi:hypothetical protein
MNMFLREIKLLMLWRWKSNIHGITGEEMTAEEVLKGFEE